MLKRMSLPEPLLALLDPRTYPHPCGEIELIETHISWVILTGSHAYKLKKPVKFAFVDFSTLALREWFCREELRCNRLFAPDLYETVLPVTRRADGTLEFDGEGEVIEWALRMHQFDNRAQLDRMLERGEVSTEMLREFGRSLAGKHQALPRLTGSVDQVDQRIVGPVEDNFAEIANTSQQQRHDALLAQTLELTRGASQRLRPLMEKRLTSGSVRECHGDLHLSNLALIDGVVTAFDCLEFNANLRWIDTMSDVAFLFMDCHVRGRADLAYAFLDGYLDESGDYEGAGLLGYYCAYRSMVRAKVAALRFEQERTESIADRFLNHLRWAHDWLRRPSGQLVLMCGVSGSGKSYVAERLVGRLPAVRLRSDVARKHLLGLPSETRSDSALDAGLYDPAHTQKVFSWLEECASSLLISGEHVIVDATFIEQSRRQRMLDRAAAQGAGACILYCQAPLDVLRSRILARQDAGIDASEATLAVLEQQLSRLQAPDDREPVIVIDTDCELTAEQIDALVAQVLSY
jgi:aminoglycoside phosphotransferase family enzyme/predicted kinase